MDQERNYFLITSSGQMGTFWLASQLNAHPEVFCSHSYDKPAWGAKDRPLEGAEGERQRAVIKERFSSLTLKTFFEENSQVTQKGFVGNVHAYNIDRALQMVQEENLDNVIMINLIRHPLSRLHSLYNCMKNKWFHDHYFDHLTFIPKIYHEHGRRLVEECLGKRYLPKFDDSLDMQFFASAVVLERGTAYQMKFALEQNIPNYKYEDITTSREAIENIAKYIGGSEFADSEWLCNQVTFKKKNSHSGKYYDNVRVIYKSWERWKKKLYQHMIGEKVFQLYTDHYYNFLI